MPVTIINPDGTEETDPSLKYPGVKETPSEKPEPAPETPDGTDVPYNYPDTEETPADKETKEPFVVPLPMPKKETPKNTIAYNLN